MSNVFEPGAPGDESETVEFNESRRLSFGEYADVYDAARPEWPAETISWLTGGLPAGGRVVELGAGTGKGTRTLVGLGLEVTAIEPSAGMRAVLAARSPQVVALDASAESLPLPDASADAVVSLQAWHWFDSLRASAECARILVPGGWLGIGWHTRDESVPWVEELAVAVRRHEDWLSGDRAQDAPPVDSAFDDWESRDFRYELVTDVDGLVALASSWSFVAMADDRQARLDAVRSLGERVAAEQAKDSEDVRVGDGARASGLIRIPHRTRCFRFQRR